MNGPHYPPDLPNYGRCVVTTKMSVSQAGLPDRLVLLAAGDA